MSDLEDFYYFVGEQLADGHDSLLPEEALALWKHQAQGVALCESSRVPEHATRKVIER